MKDFLLPIAATLAAVALDGAAASDAPDEAKTSAVRDIFTEISASIGDKFAAELGAGDDPFGGALKCTADMNDPNNPSLLDEQTCAKTTDPSGANCAWCDATASIGQGVCVSSAAKSMLGMFWDQLCAAPDTTPAATPSTPSPVPPPTAPPTPTPPPVAPEPAVSPKCTLDANSNLITDQATCEGLKDGSSATGEMCQWCQVPILGGSCISGSMKSKVSFLCRSGEETSYLRGDNEGGSKGWKQLDPSCLGGAGGLAKDKDTCATKTDSNGQPCIWCDAGNNVFGICATPSQEDYLGAYMTCAAASVANESPVVVAE
ncbi:hypothetical protein ACHAWF_005245 [Thalassiosira exigua]